MKLHHPLALTLSAALALTGGCKTDKPAPSAPAAGGEATAKTPPPAGDVLRAWCAHSLSRWSRP